MDPGTDSCLLARYACSETANRWRAGQYASAVLGMAFAIFLATQAGPLLGLLLVVPAALAAIANLRLRFVTAVDLYSDALVAEVKGRPKVSLGFAELAVGPLIVWQLGVEPVLVRFRRRGSLLDYWFYCDRPSADSLVAEFARAHREHESSRGPGEKGTCPSGWYPDPVGTHRLRWWDGMRWTQDVWNDAPSKDYSAMG